MNTSLDSQKIKKEILIKNDLQERILPKIPMDFLNMQSSPILDKLSKILDSILETLNKVYFP